MDARQDDSAFRPKLRANPLLCLCVRREDRAAARLRREGVRVMLCRLSVFAEVLPDPVHPPTK